MTVIADQARDKQIRSVTLWGALLNILLMAMKVVSGVLIRSSALIADGVHSFSDLATDLVVIVSSRLSNRPADETHPYGHKRFETLAALFISFVLLVVSFGLIWSAGRSIYLGEENYPGFMVLVVAIISVISKEFIFHVTRRVSRATRSASLYANAWHHRSDALSSIAVLIGGIAGLIGWGIADQVAAAAVGCMVLAVAGKLAYDGLVELSEHSADEESIQAIQNLLSGAETISGWHALRTRKLGGELFVDVHILVAPGLSVKEGHDISTRMEQRIKQGLTRPVNILVHIEPDIEDRHG